jgi:hypothetical protein
VLFDEEARYYADEVGQPWEQGDIVLAPSSVFGAMGDPTEGPAPAPPVGVTRTQVIWTESVDESLPQLVAEARVVPAMITTHGCTLDKEFNRAFDRLRRESVPIAEAVAQAAADDTLDRLVNIAPLVPYSDAAPSDPAVLARNQVIGFFPACASVPRGVDAGVVDLLRQTTLDRDLLITRMAVLSEDAQAAFRYALARFWLWRAPRLTFDLEEAIGKRIVDARFQTDGNFLLELELHDGSVLTLLQAPR